MEKFDQEVDATRRVVCKRMDKVPVLDGVDNSPSALTTKEVSNG